MSQPNYPARSGFYKTRLDLIAGHIKMMKKEPKDAEYWLGRAAQCAEVTDEDLVEIDSIGGGA